MAETAASRRRIGLLAESAGPLLVSSIAFFVLLVAQGAVTARFGPQGWSAEGLYSAIFNWAAIQTGFAFGVYGFVVGKSGGFIEAARGTIAMARFLSYVKTANIVGFVLTVCSIPLLISNPDLRSPDDLTYALVAGWFCLFIWAFLSFLRIAFNFGRLTSVPDAPPFYSAGH